MGVLYDWGEGKRQLSQAGDDTGEMNSKKPGFHGESKRIITKQCQEKR